MVTGKFSRWILHFWLSERALKSYFFLSGIRIYVNFMKLSIVVESH